MGIMSKILDWYKSIEYTKKSEAAFASKQFELSIEYANLAIGLNPNKGSAYHYRGASKTSLNSNGDIENFVDILKNNVDGCQDDIRQFIKLEPKNKYALQWQWTLIKLSAQDDMFTRILLRETGFANWADNEMAKLRRVCPILARYDPQWNHLCQAHFFD